VDNDIKGNLKEVKAQSKELMRYITLTIVRLTWSLRRST